MAIDQDTIDHFQPLVDALRADVDALIASGGTGTVDLTPIIARLDALEAAINVPINPIKVIQVYEDETQIIYDKNETL